MDKINLDKILVAIIVIGFLLRAINLFWGAPFFFHPDERNIASSISGLSFPNQMNPHFFAYGSLPIYLTFFLGLLKNLFIENGTPLNKVGFEDAIIILRLLSLFLSTGTIFIVYKIGSLLKNKALGIVASFLTATGVGMIQYAHFGTFEMWLTFFSTLLFLSIVLYRKNPSLGAITLLALSLAVLISVKISSAIYLPFIGFIFFQKGYSIARKGLTTFGVIFLVVLTYIVTNPFTFLDASSYINSINYESNVALGKILVFYTGEFINTSPIIFPFLKIYPFLINPINSLLIPVSIFILVISLIKNFRVKILYLLIFFFVTFLSQTFLFAQWARYFVPTLPFIYLMISASMVIVVERKKIKKELIIFGGILAVTNIIFSISFVKTVYLSKDTRVEAAKFAEENITSDKAILSEVYDLGIIPFNQFFHSITLFNFYDLDNNSPESTLNTYKDAMSKSDYLVLPSQRLYQTRITDPLNFPKGNKVYKELKDSKKYQKIYETPCDTWCKITYSLDPIFGNEQTVNVFDRPTVMIYKINHEK